MNANTTFDLLSSSVRRDLVAILHDAGPVSRRRLAAILAAEEGDDGDASEQARRDMQIALHHNHLPRLAESNLVTYDDETVTGTTRLETVARNVPLVDPDAGTQV